MKAQYPVARHKNPAKKNNSIYCHYVHGESVSSQHQSPVGFYYLTLFILATGLFVVWLYQNENEGLNRLLATFEPLWPDVAWVEPQGQPQVSALVKQETVVVLPSTLPKPAELPPVVHEPLPVVFIQNASQAVTPPPTEPPATTPKTEPAKAVEPKPTEPPVIAQQPAPTPETTAIKPAKPEVKPVETTVAETSAPKAVAKSETEAEKIAKPKTKEITWVVRKSQNLAGLFKAHGLNHQDLLKILAIKKFFRSLIQLKIGQKINVQADEKTGDLLSLTTETAEGKQLQVERQADGEFKGKLTLSPASPSAEKNKAITGKIRGSLSIDGQRAGLTRDEIQQLIQIFKPKLKFSRDLKRGDEFTVQLDEIENETGQVERIIVAAEISTQGKIYQAKRKVNRRGVVSYKITVNEQNQ